MGESGKLPHLDRAAGAALASGLVAAMRERRMPQLGLAPSREVAASASIPGETVSDVSLEPAAIAADVRVASGPVSAEAAMDAQVVKGRRRAVKNPQAAPVQSQTPEQLLAVASAAAAQSVAESKAREQHILEELDIEKAHWLGRIDAAKNQKDLDNIMRDGVGREKRTQSDQLLAIIDAVSDHFKVARVNGTPLTDDQVQSLKTAAFQMSDEISNRYQEKKAEIEAPGKVEQEPFLKVGEERKYVDIDGVMCTVKRDCDLYFYTALETKSDGSQEFYTSQNFSEEKMRPFVDGWKLVDKDTSPPLVSDATAPVKGLAAPASAPDKAPATADAPESFLSQEEVDALLEGIQDDIRDIAAKQKQRFDALVAALDGRTEFSLKNPGKGKGSKKYRIVGQEIFDDKNALATKVVLNNFNRNSAPWTLVPDQKASKKKDTPPATVAAPVADPAPPATPMIDNTPPAPSGAMGTPVSPDNTSTSTPTPSLSPDASPEATKSPEKGLFYTLGDGETAFYDSPTGKLEIRRGEGTTYEITDSKGDMRVCHESDIEVIAKQEQWMLLEQVLSDASVAAPVSPTVSLEDKDAPLAGFGSGEAKKEDVEDYNELFEGDEWVYRYPDGTEDWIKITALLGYNGRIDIQRATQHQDLEGDLDERGNMPEGASYEGGMMLDELRSELRKWGYIREKKGNKSEKLAPPVENAKEASKDESFEVMGDEEKSEIGELRARADELRRVYVKADYNRKFSWSKLKRFFGKNIGEEKDDTDTKSALDAYTGALMKLQEAQLAELKVSAMAGGTGWQEQMGQMLSYYKLDERINLYNDRKMVEAENKQWPGKVMGFLENIGKEYNKLSSKQKIFIAGVCFGTAGAAFLTGGVAAGVAASTLIGIRRVFTTLGAGVGVDGMIEGGAEWLRVRGAKKEQAAELEELKTLNTPVLVKTAEVGPSKRIRERKDLSPEALGRLEQLLAKDITSLEGKFTDQKREKIVRKTTAWGTALGLGSYYALHALYTDIATPPSGASVKALGGVVSAAGGEYTPAPPLTAASAVHEAVAPAPAAFASAASETVAPIPANSVSVPSGVIPGPGAVSDTLSVGRPVMTEGLSTETVALKVDVFREDYKVTAADGKKGLWGVLEKRLPDTDKIPKADKNRIIQSLENAMRAKLDALSPEARAAAGFRGMLSNGRVNLDLIRSGDNIDFSTLLTQQEIQGVLDGKSIVAPSGAEVTGKIANAAVSSGLSPIDQNIIDSGGTPLSAGTIGSGDMLERLEKEKIPGFERSLDKISDANYKVSIDTADTAAAPIPSHDAVIEAYDNIGNAREYLLEHPGKFSVFKSSLGHLREEIFTTSEVQRLAEQSAGPIAFTSPELGKVSVSQVLRDYQALKSNPFTSYDHNQNPLHFSQMQQLDRLLRASGKAYGVVGTQVPAGFTIDELTMRLTTMGYQEGKGIRGFLNIKP